MDQIAATAASGLRSRMEALDILSNNLANSNTGGFKVDREFYSLYQGEQATPANGQQATTLPVIQKAWTDFQQGLLTPTDNPLDLALDRQRIFQSGRPLRPTVHAQRCVQAFDHGSADHHGRLPGERGVSPPNAPPEKDPEPFRKDRFKSRPTARCSKTARIWARSNWWISPTLALWTKMGNSYYRVTDPKVKPTPAKDATVTPGQGRKLECRTGGIGRAAGGFNAAIRNAAKGRLRVGRHE